MGERLDIECVVSAVRSVLPPGNAAVALHEPNFSGNEWTYVKECLDTGWVSSVGKFVDRFEQDLAAYTGVKRAIAVVNGTAALHMSLLLVGVTANDEVLCPALTFVATANAISYCGAIPHFVDSELRSLGMDPAKLEGHLRTIADVHADGCYNRTTGRRIRAMIPMHTFGHPADMDSLLGVAGRYGIQVVEDAAESLGSAYKGRHTGNFGRVACLSFNGNKVITTGGGGAIITNDEELGRLAKHLTTTARVPHPWELTHDRVGYNYRLPNINAALGCAQLERLPHYLSAKRGLANRYQAALAGIPGVSVVREPPYASSNYWLNALMLDDEMASERDGLLKVLNDRGLQSRPAWTLMHRLPMFRDCPRMNLDTAENIAGRLINIPSSSQMGGAA